MCEARLRMFSLDHPSRPFRVQNPSGFPSSRSLDTVSFLVVFLVVSLSETFEELFEFSESTEVYVSTVVDSSGVTVALTLILFDTSLYKTGAVPIV